MTSNLQYLVPKLHAALADMQNTKAPPKIGFYREFCSGQRFTSRSGISLSSRRFRAGNSARDGQLFMEKPQVPSRQRRVTVGEERAAPKYSASTCNDFRAGRF